MAHHRVWQFRPPPERQREFAVAYASDGPWGELFAQAPGFIETRLLRGSGGWWLSIDSWDSAEAFEQFQADHADAYAALDRTLEGVAGEERFVGAFDDV